MTNNWKNINQDFTPELQKEWENKGFDYEQTKKFIDIGFEPTDCGLANFSQNVLGYNALNVFNNISLRELKSKYQKALLAEQSANQKMLVKETEESAKLKNESKEAKNQLELINKEKQKFQKEIENIQEKQKQLLKEKEGLEWEIEDEKFERLEPILTEISNYERLIDGVMQNEESIKLVQSAEVREMFQKTKNVGSLKKFLEINRESLQNKSAFQNAINQRKQEIKDTRELQSIYQELYNKGIIILAELEKPINNFDLPEERERLKNLREPINGLMSLRGDAVDAWNEKFYKLEEAIEIKNEQTRKENSLIDEQIRRENEKAAVWNRAMIRLQSSSDFEEKKRILEELKAIDNNLLQDNFREVGYSNTEEWIAEKEKIKLENEREAAEEEKISRELEEMEGKMREELRKKGFNSYEEFEAYRDWRDSDERKQKLSEINEEITGTKSLEELERVLEKAKSWENRFVPIFSEGVTKTQSAISERDRNQTYSSTSSSTSFSINDNKNTKQTEINISTNFASPGSSLQTITASQIGKMSTAKNPRYINQQYKQLEKEQTLHDWWKEGKITEAEKNKLCEFNLNGEYSLNQLKEILEEDSYINDSPIISSTIQGYIDPPTVIQDNLSNSLKRIRPNLALAVAASGTTPPGYPLIETITFPTWFNKNCATIISKLNWSKSFDVWVSVCELPVKKIDGILDIIWDSEHPNRDVARNEAAVIRSKLNGNRPALYIAPSLQVFYNNSDYLFVNIIKVDLPTIGDITNNPGNYLLPLDIVERNIGSSIYRHAAIYLGEGKRKLDSGEEKEGNWVCHVFDPGPSRSEVAAADATVAGGTTVGGVAGGSRTLSSAAASEKKKAKTRIDDWKTFLDNNPQGLIRYRITIPFKRYEKEIEQIAKAVVTEFGKNNYHGIDRNCEHFAFAIACGVNFSEQEQTDRDNLHRKFLYRRGSKISKIDLEREMNKNDGVFDNLISRDDKKVVEKNEEIKEWSEERKIFGDEKLFEKIALQQRQLKAEVRVIIPPKYHNWK